MPKTNKGQMSLEMIIGFLILLVVIIVIVNILFSTVNPDQLDTSTLELNQIKFKNDCKALCTDKESIDYCLHYFRGGEDKKTDWNGNGIEGDIMEMGLWSLCEDRIYCFLAVPCERFTSNPIKGCARELCNAYIEKYKGNVLIANEAVLDKIKPGSCNLETEVEERDNWHLSFFKPDVCGCNCTKWTDQTIGATGFEISCNLTQMYQNRVCEPAECEKEKTERCIDI